MNRPDPSPSSRSGHPGRPGRRPARTPLVRFSVAIGGDLLRRFDRFRARHQLPNRSEAVRTLMRSALIEDTVARDHTDSVGVLTLVYDHHAPGLSDQLTQIQHDALRHVVSTTHIHLDPRRCLEVILLRGPARIVRSLADRLLATKGIETGRLVLTAAEPVTVDHDPTHHPAGHTHVHPTPPAPPLP
ncbi:MAG: hypothetical protein KatS3mg108_3623 [Isosphaeraceae bacterium]|nr:MAG: hypothetical protein KatS3mg108_3623 [Isosphaeraceae bacterium]